MSGGKVSRGCGSRPVRSLGSSVGDLLISCTEGSCLFGEMLEPLPGVRPFRPGCFAMDLREASNHDEGSMAAVVVGVSVDHAGHHTVE